MAMSTLKFEFKWPLEVFEENLEEIISSRVEFPPQHDKLGETKILF